jgi:hypothetical protein
LLVVQLVDACRTTMPHRGWSWLTSKPSFTSYGCLPSSLPLCSLANMADRFSTKIEQQ